ncbi:hypothetical protein TWF106_007398 [Orbilia oligospora]|uniref:Uncharacterized protein n=1 Tax=Orbilia oligospora TaxID=2813651 RepID=A0A6G1MCR5_ORBOL|nr:hypothetical protein TWF788_011248 [Orbilia oligospora]KAF3228366.1 hypothetical protein TWF106_007398 [Orbilia oligospora]KAF3252939.1 hypothetical protein TWF192_004224 [Orbilia oligospora]
MTGSFSPVPEKEQEIRPSSAPASLRIGSPWATAPMNFLSSSSEPEENRSISPDFASTSTEPNTLNPEAFEFIPRPFYPEVPGLKSETTQARPVYPQAPPAGLQRLAPLYGFPMQAMPMQGPMQPMPMSQGLVHPMAMPQGPVHPMTMPQGPMQPMGMPQAPMQPMGMPQGPMQPMGMPQIPMQPMGMRQVPMQPTGMPQGPIQAMGVPQMSMPTPPYQYQNIPGQQQMHWQNFGRPGHLGPNQPAGRFMPPPPPAFHNPWPILHQPQGYTLPPQPTRYGYQGPPMQRVPQRPLRFPVPPVSRGPSAPLPRQERPAPENNYAQDEDPLPAPVTDSPSHMAAPNADQGCVRESSALQAGPTVSSAASEPEAAPAPTLSTTAVPPQMPSPEPAGERLTNVDALKSPDVGTTDSGNLPVIMDPVLQ